MYIYLKRAFDISISAAALILLSPLLLIIALLIRIKLGSPVLFKQVRPGLHSASFRLIKFRTMRESFDEDGNLQSNEVRMTEFGKRLRHSSLDELPELWNILRGDMSLVGPRPLLVEYLPLYNEEQRRRHHVLPGLTGWCQVNGRNALTWEEKFKLDIWYVDNASFLLDLKIIFMTVGKVLKRSGVVHNGDVAMPRFRGSNKVED